MNNQSIRGDSNLITRQYLDSILIEERLVNSKLADSSVCVFGHHYHTPIMSAAFSHLQSYSNGEVAAVAMATGMRNAGALNWWGMSNDSEMESIFQTGADTVKIVKPFADESLIFHEIEFAVQHGAIAVGMDIDHCYSSNGRYDNVLGYEMRPKTQERIHKYVLAAGETPFIVKGVLSVDDAKRCVEAGAKGLMVSHHHGIIDYAVPPLMVLPDIRKEIGNDIELFVDCGMDSAMDVYKALALGANAVSVSRHILHFLKEDGSSGVKSRIDEMTLNLVSIMSRTGAENIDDISSSVLWI